MKTNLKSETGINVQNVISKSLAIAISIALISTSLNAQVFNYSFSEKGSFNETTLAMAETTAKASLKSTYSDAFIAFAVTETEEALQIEDWMMNEGNFASLSLIATESETPLELETWMTESSIFNSNATYLEVENEEALEIENWMTDESTFNNSSFQLTEETETTLELENWMLNEELFSTPLSVDQPLAMENWMISENIWK